LRFATGASGLITPFTYGFYFSGLKEN